MDIGGYEIGQVFHVGARGPLWKTRSSAGEALIALRSSADGRLLVEEDFELDMVSRLWNQAVNREARQVEPGRASLRCFVGNEACSGRD